MSPELSEVFLLHDLPTPSRDRLFVGKSDFFFEMVQYQRCQSSFSQFLFGVFYRVVTVGTWVVTGDVQQPHNLRPVLWTFAVLYEVVATNNSVFFLRQLH